jgi:hypothetical protein
VTDETHCICPQDERLETGWGLRRAQWSPFDDPIYLMVHFGCDRPMKQLGAVQHHSLPGPVKNNPAIRRYWHRPSAVDVSA